MFFRKRRPNPNPMPRWMKWGLVIFASIIIAFRPDFSILIQHNKEENPNEIPLNEAVKNIDLTPYRQAISYRKDPEITEMKAGNGPLLLCGQTVDIRFVPRFVGSTQEETEKNAPERLHFRFGDNSTPLTLQRAITGMYTGGIRSVAFAPPIASALLGLTDKQQIDAVNIELLNATPDVSTLLKPGTALSLRLHDARDGLPPAALCGETATLLLSLWDASGKLLFSTQSDGKNYPLTVPIGSGVLPLGIEQSLIGMEAGGRRTVIIPPAWQEFLASGVMEDTQLKAIHSLGLPHDSVIIADVELVSLKPQSDPAGDEGK